MEYTKGKWTVEGNKIKVFGKGTIAICPSPTNNEGVYEFIANAPRIVDCVNGCKDINPLAVGDLYEALKRTVAYLNPDSFGEASTLDIANKALAKAKERR